MFLPLLEMLSMQAGIFNSEVLVLIGFVHCQHLSDTAQMSDAICRQRLARLQ